MIIMVMNKKERLQHEIAIFKAGLIPSIKDLAKLLGVSEPTIYQDVQLLRAAGLARVVRIRRSKGTAIEEVMNATSISKT